MKKLLLFLCLCVATAAAAFAADAPAKNSNVVNDEQAATVGRQKMVEKGKTWWYRKEEPYYGNVFNYGVSIGDEVEIDGQVWNEVNVTLCGLTDRTGQTRYEKTPQTVAYIRETDDKIISRVKYIEKYEGLLGEVYIETDIRGLGFVGSDCDTDYCLMDWSVLNEGTSIMIGNDQYDSYSLCGNYTLEDTETIENSGKSYLVYNLKPVGNERWHIREDFKYVEGLGLQILFNHFFLPFVPVYTRGTEVFSWPVLSYITDPDRNVIYEGEGGEKLWEMAGVEMPTVESREAVRWYNLQGVEIPEPHSAGIYIRREGLNSQKVKVE